MPKDTQFSTKMKYSGIFDFREFYNFSFNWLKGEMGMSVSETEYEEKVKGNEKEIKIIWEAKSKPAEYFHNIVKVEFEIKRLAEVEIVQNGKKIKTNTGDIKIKVKAELEKDPAGQFETTAKIKVWRTMYEKFLIPSRVKEYEDKLAGATEEFAAQMKSFLAIEAQMAG